MKYVNQNDKQWREWSNCNGQTVAVNLKR